MADINPKLNIERAVEAILSDIYFKEFVVIDGLN